MKRICLLLLFSLFVAMIVQTCSKPSGVLIVVANNTGALIEDLDVIYTGGGVKVPLLADGESCELRIVVKGESGLTLDFAFRGSEKRLDVPGTYIEPSYDGRIRVMIDKDLDLNVVDEIKPRPAGSMFYRPD